ncbi:aldehyde dehydrogenase family protein [Saccharothrix violaceirubra]|uniref:Acyl-CoA reductase-like NAD-dependent aldehyde dehydrogenase n=1 Tax=Saccharothrix violaceirubra TaxID=413306 RepID=A0A7W7WV98_9PSEU|nr:aldehyde dehydrogenase family protein [Saccharothrix violaceirubra]MBB4965104.1 acyl-CoA reductase-like NAD-dependent aldehyde dehydrogenase [Saccharothrix violaceirubra]
MPSRPAARNLIDGKWVDRNPRDSLAPATGEVLGVFADGGAAEADAAIAAARTAFTTTSWARDRDLRARALLELADRLQARRDEFVTLLARENGKILAEAAFEVDMAVPKLRYAAALALTDTGRSAEVKPDLYSLTVRQPAGVAGVIVPWNAPVVLAVRSFAPALAAGCTVAMKMPAQTALVNGLLYEVIAATESLPPGVLNAFTESGNEGAPLLVSDPRVDVVSYTGSTTVGREIMTAAARTLKPLSLELGGKTPMIVFDDADLDRVVPALTKAVTTFTGQFCMAGSRVLAQRGIADRLRAALVESLGSVRVGPGDDPASEMGPMVDVAAARRVDGIVADAESYATVLVRGGIPTEPELAGGAFFRPSLVEVGDTAASIVQREVFGPVATFEVFDDEADAIARANATEYGLAASVWTTDVDRPLRVGRDLDVGTVWTNTWAVVHDQFEEGGFKQSGLGRLNGARGLEEFQEVKHFVHPVHR